MLSVLVCMECGGNFESKRNDAKRCEVCRVTHRRVDFRNFELRRIHPCADCGEPCGRKSTRCHSCDTKFRNGLRVMEDSPSWRGGRHKRKKDGYIEIRIAAKTNVLEHRYVWEQANGPIPDKWVVHHLNGIKDDNRLENLVAMSRSHHGPRAHIDPSEYERRIRDLEAEIARLTTK